MFSKNLPVAIVFLTAMVILGNHFVPGTFLAGLTSHFLNWTLVLAAVAMVLGTANLVSWNWKEIRRKTARRYNALLTIAGLILFTAIGLGGGGPAGPLYSKMFTHILVAFNASFWSVVLFFIVSAAFRAFVIRNWQASLILASSLIVMLGQVPVGDALVPGISDVAVWLRDVPNLAGQRGIMIGAAIGAISQQLRVIVGLERGHFGG